MFSQLLLFTHLTLNKHRLCGSLYACIKIQAMHAISPRRHVPTDCVWCQVFLFFLCYGGTLPTYALSKHSRSSALCFPSAASLSSPSSGVRIKGENPDLLILTSL